MIHYKDQALITKYTIYIYWSKCCQLASALNREWENIPIGVLKRKEKEEKEKEMKKNNQYRLDKAMASPLA